MAGVHGMSLATHAGAFDYIDSVKLYTAMTLGTATSEYSWATTYSAGSGGATYSLTGYDGGSGARYDDFQRGAAFSYSSAYEQTPDNFGGMDSTDVDGRTLLYLYVVSSSIINTVDDELYLGFTGTGTVSFTSITINGNTLNQSDASTSTFDGNRYYQWNNADGIIYPGNMGRVGYPIPVPASGPINVTIT